MTPQQTRRFTLALNAFSRAESQFQLWIGFNDATSASKGYKKRARAVDRARKHLYTVVTTLVGEGARVDPRRCTCPGAVDITFTGHLPDCPCA